MVFISLEEGVCSKFWSTSFELGRMFKVCPHVICWPRRERILDPMDLVSFPLVDIVPRLVIYFLRDLEILETYL